MIYKERKRSACGLAGRMREEGERFSGEKIMRSISTLQERSNGLGGGFSAYGIYPDYKELYAFHLILESEEAKVAAEEYLKEMYLVREEGAIPTREPEGSVDSVPILWRYFLEPRKEKFGNLVESDYVMRTVMEINSEIEDAFVVSSGKNMGIFKGVGFPEDIGRFYRLDDYEAYTWIAHGRFPTNTSGWWEELIPSAFWIGP